MSGQFNQNNSDLDSLYGLLPGQPQAPFPIAQSGQDMLMRMLGLWEFPTVEPGDVPSQRSGFQRPGEADIGFHPDLAHFFMGSGRFGGDLGIGRGVGWPGLFSGPYSLDNRGGGPPGAGGLGGGINDVRRFY